MPHQVHASSHGVPPDGQARSVSRFVQVVSCQAFKLLKVIWPERFRNFVLLVEPFAQVNQLAPLRAERAERAGKPIARLLTRWTPDSLHPKSTYSVWRMNATPPEACAFPFAEYQPDIMLR